MRFQVGETSKQWAEKSQIACWYQPQTTSTNLIAKENPFPGEAISLYLTEHQSSGRGRGEHSWSAPAGAALLSSWSFLMRKNPHPILSPALGLALWTALRASFPWLHFSLKAPNDLYLGKQKIAGLLLENQQLESHHRLILGLGINIWDRPPAIETSTSLYENLLEPKNEQLQASFTAEAWFSVLDRLLLEFSLSISQTKESLSPIQCQSLLAALNLYPGLTSPYTQVDPDGSLWIGSKKVNWSEL